MENSLPEIHQEKSQLENVLHEPQITAPTEELIHASVETGHAQPGVHVRSKKWLFRVGLAVAVLNPVFSGVLIGVFFLREPELKREGKIILTTAIVWGVFVLVLAFFRDWQKATL